MKKLILLFVTVFAFQFSQAQYNIDIAEATPQQEQKADKQSKMLTKKLGLNGEQPLLVRNKMLEFQVKRDEIINDKSLNKQEKVENDTKRSAIANIVRSVFTKSMILNYQTQ